MQSTDRLLLRLT